MFTQKLEEYWQLSQLEPPRERGTPQPAAVAGEIERHASGVPGAPLSAFAAPPWPDMGGQQVADTLRAFVAGQSVAAPSTGAQHSSTTDLSDKIALHNVFHIAVQMAGAGGVDSLQDLSDKVADILHAQAVQHGIDIT